MADVFSFGYMIYEAHEKKIPQPRQLGHDKFKALSSYCKSYEFSLLFEHTISSKPDQRYYVLYYL